MLRRNLQLDDPSGASTLVRTSTPPVAGPSFVGHLAPGVGARLFMQLLAEGASGRLVVETVPGDARSRAVLFFLRGEPVHAEPADGAASLWRQLGDGGHAQGRRTVADGVASLARLGARPVPILEALRELVRTTSRAVLESFGGTFSYFDDPAALDHVPLVAVHPFGLVLEHKRRSMAPDALLRTGEQLATSYCTPAAGFSSVCARITAFTGHIDLGPLVDGTRRGAALFQAMRVDAVTGGLLLSSLLEGGLLEVSSLPRATPRAAPVLPPRAQVAPLALSDDALPLTQLRTLGPTEEEVLTLYLELKPERDHTALLGVDIDCKRAALDRAYEARLAQLDPRLVPAGPVRPYLLARVEELRAKVDRAYRAHAARTPRDVAGAYILLDRIGSGGMAEVFRGRSTEDGRIVAIKRIRPENKDDGEFVRKLLDEARLARRVRHPNVVRVHTAGKSGDDVYLAMDWVEGDDLHGLIGEARRRGVPVPLSIACRIIADACGGLHAAHTTRDGRGASAPILHCDVSTSNILVSLRGEVKLTDFGIARALGQKGTDSDGPGVVRGKLPYLSPELLEGGEPSVRSDLYAMGMSLYAALTRLPFHRADEFDTMKAVLLETLPPASTTRPDVPPELDLILLRACARDPAQRFESAQALQLALEEWLATRPAGSAGSDLGAWVQALSARPAAVPMQGDAEERTVSVQPPEESDSSRSAP